METLAREPTNGRKVVRKHRVSLVRELHGTENTRGRKVSRRGLEVLRWRSTGPATGPARPVRCGSTRGLFPPQLAETARHVLRAATERVVAQTLHLPPAVRLNTEPGGGLTLLQQLDQPLPVRIQKKIDDRGRGLAPGALEELIQ